MLCKPYRRSPHTRVSNQNHLEQIAAPQHRAPSVPAHTDTTADCRLQLAGGLTHSCAPHTHSVSHWGSSLSRQQSFTGGVRTRRQACASYHGPYRPPAGALWPAPLSFCSEHRRAGLCGALAMPWGARSPVLQQSLRACCLPRASQQPQSIAPLRGLRDSAPGDHCPRSRAGSWLAKPAGGVSKA